MNTEFFLKHRLITAILAFIIVFLMAVLQIYDTFFRYHISAKFVTANPLYSGMPVYYRGYKIGETQSVELSKDYKYTLVKILLYPKNPKLPDTTIAKIKKFDMRKDYIELIESGEQSEGYLKNDSIIEGEPAFDLESLINDLLDSGVLNPVIDNISEFIASMNDTSDKMGTFFADSNNVLKANKQNINKTTQSLQELTSKINNSINENEVKDTISNITKSSENIVTTTENIKNISTRADCATKNIGETSDKVDKILTDTRVTASNVKEITCGMKRTLNKRFTLLRLIFGRAVNSPECKN